MVVNDVPGEECRIAILEDKHLEELYTERTDTATNVGNIYKGRVTNIEPAIQAAFIDYGQGTNGFLHISDLHPRYFPGKEVTERVGKKIPRHARPPIQEALRRGDEVLVQVMKQGIGSKGPTLTSYLSIPGRLLVLMPGMDRVGVSRKVDDDDTRRAMRDVLDTLDIPDGFGVIVRTAGLGRTKTELKRDIAYLMRLWKAMERREHNAAAPCELYVESDLLVRTIRDVLRPSIKAIVVDSESAFDRASNFLTVVAPRSAPDLIRYHRPTPIFHAFDIERQIDLIHSRLVPLASGGELVIDQTEALVAIDVNSGKSRSARDSETNAVQTNLEAVDEICRQLRLRDLGGLLVNDLIDMRHASNRKKVEERMRNNLKRDRAKTTTLPISRLGLLEMTRQRMRPSMRNAHFAACSHCSGRGEIKVPESIASEATRQAGYLLQFDRVIRIELVCSPRVASVLLSRKRRELVRLEDLTGKQVHVRVSEAIAEDRVDFYAYDDRNTDIDVERLPKPKSPSLKELVADKPAVEVPTEEASDVIEPKKKSRRRRRRRRGADVEDTVQSVPPAPEEAAVDVPDQETPEPTEDVGPKKKRRRRRRGGAGRKSKATAGQEPAVSTDEPAPTEPESDSSPDERTSADNLVAGRIYAISRDIGTTSKDILQACDALDIDVKNHMSSLTVDQVQAVCEQLNVEGQAPTETDETSQPVKKSRRRKRSGRSEKKPHTSVPPESTGAAGAPSDSEESTSSSKKKRRSRKRARAATGGKEQGADPSLKDNGVATPDTVVEAVKRKPRRALYRNRKRPNAPTMKDTKEAAE
jgi:ribonuclease E